MSKKYIYLAILICFLATKVSAQEYFTLPMALTEVEAHTDYQNWLNSIDKIETKISSILSKQNPSLAINGQPISLSYKIKDQASSVSTSMSLTYSQKLLSGTSLSASLSTGKELSNSNAPWNTKWSCSLEQAIFPNPQLSNDRLDILYNQNSLVLIEQQREYVVEQIIFKIEELYRQAQLVEAKVIFAEHNLAAEKNILMITNEKDALGEASESDHISARLGVLRAEKELEQAKINANNARKKIQDILILDELPILPPLDLNLFLGETQPLELNENNIPLEKHPLLLQYLVEIEKAQKTLLAAKEGLRPNASIAIRLGEAQNTNDIQVGASLSINYGIWDGGQKKDAVKSQDEHLKSCEETYEKELANLILVTQDSLNNLENKFRELEISELMLKKATLEYEAAQVQHSFGSIDSVALEKQRMQFLQAQLTHWENKFQYDINSRKIAAGIFADFFKE